MKQSHPLQSGEYSVLHQSFTQWLILLNYSPGTIQVIPGHVKEFLYHQQEAGKARISELTAGEARGFIAYLTTRTGPRTGRPYSNTHLNKYIQALQLFSRYLRESGEVQEGFTLRRKKQAACKVAWLTLDEIQRLYQSTADTILGMRDRAMLAVYYGCGLRLSEGAALEVRDILPHSSIMHVRQGKGYKERFVPLAAAGSKTLEQYIRYGRPELLQQRSTQTLFIGANTGLPMHTQSLYIRVRQLAKRACIKKKVGTHTLRHSIATHLLQSGMKLERIKDFLGHSSLDSTQRYTHLVNDTL